MLGAERWIAICVYAALITAATLGAFWLALGPFGMSESAALTVSFLTLATAQLWHVFNMRDAGSRLGLSMTRMMTAASKIR